MGKHTKRRGDRPGASDLYSRAVRELEKEDFKQALKDAKVCYREAPSEERRRLLERAWLARARALFRAGLQAESRAATQDLLDFGVTEPSVQRDLPELLLAVGLFDRASAGNGRAPAAEAPAPSETDPRLLAVAADHAVLDPVQAAGTLPGIREGAARVRAALDALCAGDEEAARQALQDVPRHSPFADWRWFARGLAAYYRCDDEGMRSAWDRLAPGRLAARTAAPLRRLAEAAAGPPEKDPAFGRAVRLLEELVFGHSITADLERLQADVAQGNWGTMKRGLGRLREACRRATPDLLARIDRLIVETAVRKGESDWLGEVTGVLDPPADDPRWNRARALTAESEGEDAEDSERYWRAYLADLEQMPGLSDSDRRLAQALVWERMGRSWALEDDEDDEYEEDYEEDYEGEYEEEDYEDEEEEDGDLAPPRARAVEYLNKALDLAPSLLSAYTALAQVHEERDETEQAVQTHRRLLERFPDHFDSLVYLFRHHLGRDEMLLARQYALSAHALRPTSREAAQMASAGQVDYRGRSDHLKRVLDYVCRSGRVRWQCDDLRMEMPRFDVPEFSDWDEEEGEVGPGAAIPPGEMFRKFRRMCEQLGMDPEEVLHRAAQGGMSFRFDSDPRRGRKPAARTAGRRE